MNCARKASLSQLPHPAQTELLLCMVNCTAYNLKCLSKHALRFPIALTCSFVSLPSFFPYLLLHERCFVVTLPHMLVYVTDC